MKYVLALSLSVLAACAQNAKKEECKECAESEKAYEMKKTDEHKNCGCGKEKKSDHDHKECKGEHKS